MRLSRLICRVIIPDRLAFSFLDLKSSAALTLSALKKYIIIAGKTSVTTWRMIYLCGSRTLNIRGYWLLAIALSHVCSLLDFIMLLKNHERPLIAFN